MEGNKWKAIFRTIFNDSNKSGDQKAIDYGQEIKQKWKNEPNKTEELEKILKVIITILTYIDERALKIRDIFGDDIERDVINIYLDLIKETWGNLTEEEQRKKWDKVTEGLDSEIALARIFSMARDELKMEKGQDVFNRIKKNEYAVEIYWESLSLNEQIARWDEFINLYPNHEEYLVRILKSAKVEARAGKISKMTSKIENDYIIVTLWKSLSLEEQTKEKDTLFSETRIKKMISKKEYNALNDMLEHSSDNIRKEKLKIILKNIPRNVNDVQPIWEKMTIGEMKENTFIIIDTLKQHIEEYDRYRFYSAFGKFWQSIPEEIQIMVWPKIFEIIKNNKFAIVDIFANSSEKLRNSEAEILINLFTQDEEYTRRVWTNCNENTKEKYIDILLSAINSEASEIYEMWESASADFQLKHWNDVMNRLMNKKLVVRRNIWSATKLAIQRIKWNEIVNGKLYQTIWENTKPELQEEKWPALLKVNWDNIHKINVIWGGLNKKVQQKNGDAFDEIFEKYKNNVEGIGLFWNSTCMELQKTKWKRMMAIIKDEPTLVEPILANTDDSVIKENLNIVIEIAGQDIQLLGKIWARSLLTQNVMWNQMIELVKEDPNKLSAIWKNTRGYVQEKHLEVFQTLLSDFENNGEELADIWINTSNAIQKNNQGILIEIIEKLPENSDFATKIWNETEKEVLSNINAFPKLIRVINPNITEQEFEEIKSQYEVLEKANVNVAKTINLKILNLKLMNKIDMKQIIRLTLYPDLQEKIANYIDNDIFIEIIGYVCNNTPNWNIFLNRLLSNIEKYEDLLNNLDIADLQNKAIMDNIIKIIIARDNYFNITNAEQVKDFEAIRRKFCYRLLEEEVDDLPESIKVLTPEQRATFAMLELSFGIDIEEAENLVYKYGEDIERLQGLTKEEENLRDTINAIKLILSNDDNRKIFLENILEIKQWMNEIKPSTIATLETEAIKMYSRLYKETIQYEEQPIYNVTYEGKAIQVSEIISDFNVFVRSQGAYTSWEEPEDFSKEYTEEHMPINGKCTCFAGQDLIALARAKGPLYGYENPNLLLVAPWDIVSNSANARFSPIRS